MQDEKAISVCADNLHIVFYDDTNINGSKRAYCYIRFDSKRFK